MVSLERAIVAHLKIEGEEFQILVDPDMALEYRQGKSISIAKMMAVDEVFKDARKGERHKSSALQKAFGTEDVGAIAQRIIDEGNIALTTEQRRKLVVQKREAIAALIAREAIDPRTGAVHTLARITQAMDKARLDIDPIKDASAQMEETLDKIKLLLPIKLARKKIAIKVPPSHAHRAYGMLKMQGMQKEQWANDGSLICVVEVPAGLVGEFFDRLNKATAATVETRMLE
ncbi:MAG: ribosome assembly factor SBDS [Candidatus Micrarchaeota archaeon]